MGAGRSAYSQVGRLLCAEPVQSGIQGAFPQEQPSRDGQDQTQSFICFTFLSVVIDKPCYS